MRRVYFTRDVSRSQRTPIENFLSGKIDIDFNYPKILFVFRDTSKIPNTTLLKHTDIFYFLFPTYCTILWFCWSSSAVVLHFKLRQEILSTLMFLEIIYLRIAFAYYYRNAVLVYIIRSRACILRCFRWFLYAFGLFSLYSCEVTACLSRSEKPRNQNLFLANCRRLPPVSSRGNFTSNFASTLWEIAWEHYWQGAVVNL